MTQMEEGMRGELGEVLELIRQAGGGLVLEEFPGALEDVPRMDATGDDRSAMRRALIDQANRLAETRERMRHGEAGI
jgi:hypothetical protein